jgi:GNAT superfamily N-acetyltransferase
MLDDIVIEPMSEEFVLWRCLHGGPLTRQSIDHWRPGEEEHLASQRERNLALVRKITEAYGACAIVARDGEKIAGTLRFYPKALWSKAEPGAFCLQGFPLTAHGFLIGMPLPSFDELEDKTLRVHCLMAGSPFQKENPYQRKGVGTRMVQGLIRWARRNGWEGIEATAVEDLAILYEHTGQAGKRFWEKCGFRTVSISKGPRSGLPGPVLEIAREQARAQGLDPDLAETYLVRLDRTDPGWLI